MQIFFWNGSNEGDKIYLIAWEKICQPKEEGGSGIRNWQLMNKALGAKLIWAMFENPQLYWVRIVKGKYLDSYEAQRILMIQDPPKG